MTRYLSVEQALRIARAAVGGPMHVQDVGLLESAVHRPRASVLGQDAYPNLLTKAPSRNEIAAKGISPTNRKTRASGPFKISPMRISQPEACS